MTAPTAGFTLLELLLAMTMTALVMASSLVTVDLFTAADRSAISGYELDTEAQRALRLLAEDAQDAVAITTGVRSLRFERAGGKFVTWVSGDEELHRLTGDSSLAVDPAVMLLLNDLVPLQFDARGRLRDGSYRESAVLQGPHAFALQMVTSARNGAVIGVQVAITTAAGEQRSRRTVTACSSRLVEANCKPPI